MINDRPTECDECKNIFPRNKLKDVGEKSLEVVRGGEFLVCPDCEWKLAAENASAVPTLDDKLGRLIHDMVIYKNSANLKKTVSEIKRLVREDMLARIRAPIRLILQLEDASKSALLTATIIMDNTKGDGQ